jgi:hypothetical protein
MNRTPRQSTQIRAMLVEKPRQAIQRNAMEVVAREIVIAPDPTPDARAFSQKNKSSGCAARPFALCRNAKKGFFIAANRISTEYISCLSFKQFAFDTR